MRMKNVQLMILSFATYLVLTTQVESASARGDAVSACFSDCREDLKVRQNNCDQAFTDKEGNPISPFEDYSYYQCMADALSEFRACAVFCVRERKWLNAPPSREN